MYYTSKRAREGTRLGMIARIEEIRNNILMLEEELEQVHWYARIGINRNLRARRAQLSRYLDRWDRYEDEGWI